MSQASANSFTHSHIVLRDGTVAFKCSADKELWPWLALPPFDPIVVQTVNFWTSVETGAARGTFDKTKWSALTQTEWTCGEPGAGHATHGVANVMGEEGAPRFGLTFFDSDGALVYSMSGVGVVFLTRDFEAWREKAKREMAELPDTSNFQFAPANAVGVATQGQSFLSPLIGHDNPSALALITKESGFPPVHPFLSGSGDHVNSTHLADVARQFVQLLTGAKSLMVSGGDMQFKRYVELGHPFLIELEQQDRSENTVSMAIRQADRLCANVTLKYQVES